MHVGITHSTREDQAYVAKADQARVTNEDQADQARVTNEDHAYVFEKEGGGLA